MWEKYKELMGAISHNLLEKWLKIPTFYNGLIYNTRMTIDAAAEGTLMNKSFNDAYVHIDNMAQSHYD